MEELHLTKKTLQVLCNLKTPTPLQDVLKSQSSGNWRIKESTLSECTHLEVFDEETKTKVGGPITGYTYTEGDDTMGKGFVIYFTPKEIGGSLIRSYNSTRPKFNMIGWNVK